jgi:uncharacterized protein with HEPN domain
MSQLLGSALLAIVDEAGRGVLTLTEGLEPAEFLRSRLTRAEVLKLLRQLAAGMAEVPVGARERLPEIDWAAWAALQPRLDSGPPEAQGEALWFAVQSLVPATLLWLEVYRRDEPGLFRMHA